MTDLPAVIPAAACFLYCVLIVKITFKYIRRAQLENLKMPNLAATIRNADDARNLTDGTLDVSTLVTGIMDTIEREATAGNDKAVSYIKDKRSLRRLRRRFESLGFTVTETENAAFVEFIVSW